MKIKSSVRAGVADADKMGTIDSTTDVASPRDVAAGQASGKRTYKPIRFTVETGPTLPLP